LPPGEARSKVERFNVLHKEIGVAFRNGLKQLEASGFDVVAGDRATDGIDRDCAIVLRESGGAIVAHTSAAIARAKAKQRRAVIASVGVMATVIVAGLVAALSFSRASSDAIATGATQFASGSGYLSERTEEQASALQ
jgi:hypothetical protein